MSSSSGTGMNVGKGIVKGTRLQPEVALVSSLPSARVSPEAGEVDLRGVPEELLRPVRRRCDELVARARAGAAAIEAAAAAQRAEALETHRRAREEADRLVAEAAARVEQRLAEAWREGYAGAQAEGFAAGHAAGLAAVHAEIDGHLQRLRQLAAEARASELEIVRSAEQELARLAVAVAEKLVQHELAADPEVVLGITRAALAEAGPAGPIRIRVNPVDWEVVRERWERLARSPGEPGGAGSVEIVADDRISAGGCIVETRAGWVDGQIDSQLDVVRSGLGIGG